MSAVSGVTSTLSKHPALFPANVPRRLVKAKGAQVWSDDGRRFVDGISGLLAVTLGHHHPKVTEAVRRHLRAGGPTWSLAHPLEERVADTIRRLAGFPDGQVRFVRTGSEACSAALRIARAHTGRDLILSAGYHGWAADCLTAPPAWGVPAAIRALTRTFPFNDLAAAERAFFGLDPDPDGRLNGEDPSIDGSQLAAVLVEPETLDAPVPGFLQGLRALCTRYGALLIFDEAITGGRHGRFTAGQQYGVTPDLLVLSKCLANGYALACVVGPREVMACFDVDYRGVGPVYVSGTWSTETVGLAAAEATLAVWESERVGERLPMVGEAYRTALYGVSHAIAGGATRDGAVRLRLRGQPYRLALETVRPDGTNDPVALTLLRQYLCDEGLLVGSGLNVMLSHQEPAIQAQVVAAWERAVTRWQHVEGGDIGRRAALHEGQVALTPYRQA